jgi:nucleoside-diphosphate-sugar epimerase
MTRVLVTGATGFIGSMLCDALSRSGYLVRGALRAEQPVPVAIAEKIIVGDINSTTDWMQALKGVDAVIHTAARTHVLHTTRAGANLYCETNERGTQRLANAAAQTTVSRFVFLSSIKVNGEETSVRAYSPLDAPRPQDEYGLSKWHAEQEVTEIAARCSMEAVIVRPPLVYGPRVRANFLRLLQWVDHGWPLPLGAVRNIRSLVNIWNLCDFLLHVLKHPSAPGRTWMVSDGEDLSTPELIRRVGTAMGRRVRLIPVPAGLLQLSARLVGRRGELARLTGSLAVDITQSRVELGWSPRTAVDEALARTVAWYLNEARPGEA